VTSRAVGIRDPDPGGVVLPRTGDAGSSSGA
jgi:hypothetical protein